MTRAIVNRTLLALFGVVCVVAGSWLLTARYSVRLLPAGAAEYVTTRRHQPLAGPASRRHLLQATHGWFLPGALAAVFVVAVLFVAWQYATGRVRTLRVGTALVDAPALAHRISADAQLLEEVAAARATFVARRPPRLRLVVRPHPDVEPSRVLNRLQERLIPNVAATCAGSSPQIEIRIVGRRTRRRRPARVK